MSKDPFEPPASPEPDAVHLMPFDPRPTQATRDAMLSPASPEPMPDQHIEVQCAHCGVELSVSVDELSAALATQCLTVVDAASAKVLEVLNTPETADFDAGVPREALHQQERWGADRDAGKAPADWFWLIGYLAGKALASAICGNTEKALHHCISTAAVLRNWHSHIQKPGKMRPGIEDKPNA